MKKLLKKLYWICILVCILLVTFCGSSSAEGTLGFFALAILIIVPIVSRLKMGKKSQESADRWLKNRRVEIHADQIDYQTNMEIYRCWRSFSRLEYSADGKIIHNPTSDEVWLCDRKGKTFSIKPGETVNLNEGE